MINQNSELILLIFASVVAALITVVAVRYYSEYFRDIRYVKMEIGRADSLRERVYWQRELYALYFCVIPGVTPEFIKKARAFFRKRRKNKEQDALMPLIAPSVFAIIVCMLCVVGSSFAWFSTSMSSPTQKIEAANYSISVSVNGEDKTAGTLLPAGEYELSVTALGSAKVGYCSIKCGDAKSFNEYHTVPILTAEGQNILSIKIKLTEQTQLTFTPQWGSSAKDESLWLKESVQDEQPYTLSAPQIMQISDNENSEEQKKPQTENNVQNAVSSSISRSEDERDADDTVSSGISKTESQDLELVLQEE